MSETSLIISRLTLDLGTLAQLLTPEPSSAHQRASTSPRTSCASTARRPMTWTNQPAADSLHISQSLATNWFMDQPHISYHPQSVFSNKRPYSVHTGVTLERIALVTQGECTAEMHRTSSTKGYFSMVGKHNQPMEYIEITIEN